MIGIAPARGVNARAEQGSKRAGAGEGGAVAERARQEQARAAQSGEEGSRQE